MYLLSIGDLPASVDDNKCVPVLQLFQKAMSGVSKLKIEQSISRIRTSFCLFICTQKPQVRNLFGQDASLIIYIETKCQRHHCISLVKRRRWLRSRMDKAAELTTVVGSRPSQVILCILGKDT